MISAAGGLGLDIPRRVSFACLVFFVVLDMVSTCCMFRFQISFFKVPACFWEEAATSSSPFFHHKSL